MEVIKRDGSLAPFQKNKISTAILKAMKKGSGIVKPKIATDIAKRVKAIVAQGNFKERPKTL